MSDKPHENAVRSPWTEGAWIMLLHDADGRCEARSNIASPWRRVSDIRDLRTLRTIVEARPSGGES